MKDQLDESILVSCSKLVYSIIVSFQGTPDCLKGTTFLITGILECIERDDAHALIERCGGKVMKTLGKKTDYLVVGREAGAGKLAKVSVSVRVLIDLMVVSLFTKSVKYSRNLFRILLAGSNLVSTLVDSCQSNERVSKGLKCTNNTVYLAQL